MSLVVHYNTVDYRFTFHSMDIHDQKLIGGVIIGLMAGALGGYAVGYSTAYTAVVPDAEITRTTATPGVNTLGDVEANPYEGIKLNPFE